MKSRVTFFSLLFPLLTVLLAGCSASKSAGGIPADPRKLGLDPIEFKMPVPERWTLPNGLSVYYFFDDELPQMRARMYLPGGSLYDDSGIAGLASATGAQMREGGIPGYAPEAFDKHLDDLAASIESSYGEEYGSVGCFSLVEDFEHVFGLFSEVIRQPKFDTSRLSLWKKLAGDGIARRKDDPETMAAMAFNQLIFGERSPYSNPITEASLAKISIERMRQYHGKFVHPNGARLSITGAMPREQVKALIEKTFGNWQSTGIAVPPPPPMLSRAPKGIYVLERKFDQTTVIMGHRGPPRYPPDLFDISVFNSIFGHGGFSTTLFQEIRSRLGLAYSVYGSIVPDITEGTFQVVLQTRNEAVPEALRESIRLTRESTVQLPNDKQFSEAKSSTERSFVFKFAEPSSIVDRAPLLEILGYPADFDANYLDRLRAVSKPNVRDAAAKWVHPDDLIVVVVGGVEAKALAQQFDLPVYKLEFDTAPKVVGPVTK